MFDFAAIVAAAAARAASAAPANLVPVKRDAGTGRMVRAAAPVKPSPVKVIPTPAPVVTPETSWTFITAIRAAAKIKIDAERIAAERDAVIAFVGRYERAGYHPKAVNDATSLASRTIAAAKHGASTAPSRAEQRAHNATLRGYVAGVHDAAATAANDAAARRRILVALVLDLRRVTTREALHAALVNGGRDEAKIALHLASDAEAVALARSMAASLAAEHGIAE